MRRLFLSGGRKIFMNSVMLGGSNEKTASKALIMKPRLSLVSLSFALHAIFLYVSAENFFHSQKCFASILGSYLFNTPTDLVIPTKKLFFSISLLHEKKKHMST